MKKQFVLIFLIFCSMVCYSQTWVEILDPCIPNFGTGAVTKEYTIITREQFNRLVEQYKVTYGSCNFKYTDVVEMINFPVISGTRPIFNSYYFLLVRTRGIPIFPSSSDTILIYGHPTTGRLELEFGRRGVSVNSNEFTKQWNQYLGWVRYKNE